MTITYRGTKGSKLTIAELDENFRDLADRAAGVSTVAGKAGAVILVKGDVGLGSVDNTADADKPVSTAAATALAGKQATLVSGTNLRTVNGQTLLGSSDITVTGAVASVAGRTGAVVLAKADVGLANVDNTTDAAKPVSTATQTALNAKANLASPTFTGTVGGITKAMVGLTNVDDTPDTAKPVSTAQSAAIAAAVAPKAPATFTARALTNADDGTTFVCASAQVATVNTGLVSGFGCAFKGAVTFVGSATVTDVRTTGSANPWCSLVQTAANGYDVVGTKA